MSNDERPLTLRDVAAAALRNTSGRSGREWDRYMKDVRGLEIVYTTVSNMAGGRYKSQPKLQTLAALAELSGYTLQEVHEAAALPMPLTPLRDDLPPDADLLDGPQRRVVIDTIRLFAQQNKALVTLRGELDEGGVERDRSAANQTAEPELPEQAGEPSGPNLTLIAGAGMGKAEFFFLPVLVQYLAESGGDPATAANKLANDGAKGANLDEDSWVAALEALANQVSEDHVEELEESAAARRRPGGGPKGPDEQRPD